MRGSMWHAEDAVEEETHDRPAYRSFLVRCWREEDGSPEQLPMCGDGELSTWRFMVMEVGGTQRWRGIASLEDLMCFLRAHLGP